MGLFDWLKNKPSPKKSGQDPEWKVGDRVLAKWYDSFFYPGRVQAVSGNSCRIAFDDGDSAEVHCAHMLTPDINVGSRVFGRLRTGPAYYPGVVNQQKGEKILIRYDHGEDEWTTWSMVRVQRNIANVGDQEPPPPSGPVKLAVDVGEPVEEGNWRVADRVLARWLDFYWYPGTILAMGQKGFQILYDDGGQLVVPEQALMPLMVEEGEHIFIRPKNEPQRIYSPAVVTRVAGETLDVEMEDGTRETNTKVSRVRLWRSPVGAGAFPFEEGDRVLAYDGDGCIYPAEILSIQDERIIVQYLDGPERMLTPELVKKFNLPAGIRVECRWKAGPNYLPGVLAKMDGDRVQIHYDDGDQEWTSVRLVRIPAGG